MRRIALLVVVPAALFAAEARYARLGDFEGTVEVQPHAADAWRAAERNLPLTQSAWLRTGAASRLEIELDEGSVWRVGPASQFEISDYTRLSTGQRITLLSLDRGLAYFTGQAEGKDSLILAVPGAQLVFARGARVRLLAEETFSQIWVIEGAVRFSSPTAELEIREGQTTRVEPANPSRFYMNRELPAMELDRWSEERDKAQESSPSYAHVVHRYGLQDLDSGGEWVQTDDLGTVWKPKVAAGWRPFQKGRWRWLEGLGYCWVSDESWGWLPYHYGRWTRRDDLGWIWVPSMSPIFKPGDVYWLRGSDFSGWGPLAPGEQWTPPRMPQQYALADTVFASFRQDAMLIDPANFSARPKDPLDPRSTMPAAFAEALPSPALLPSRLENVRPMLMAVNPRVVPAVPGASPEPASQPAVVLNPAPPPPVVVVSDPPPPPPQDPPWSGPPVAIGYPVPVAIYDPVVVNMPSHPDYSQRLPRQVPGNMGTPGQQPQTQTQQPTPSSSRTPIPRTTPVNPGTPRPSPGGDGGKTRTPTPLPGKPVSVDKKFQARYEDDAQKQLTTLIAAQEYDKALQVLDHWSQKFAETDAADVRLYFYMQAYNGLRQPAKVLDSAAPLSSREWRHLGLDDRQTIGALFLVTTNAVALNRPTHQQILTSRSAARVLLDAVPRYFVPANKPQPVTEADWTKARNEMLATARSTLAVVSSR